MYNESSECPECESKDLEVDYDYTLEMYCRSCEFKWTERGNNKPTAKPPIREIF